MERTEFIAATAILLFGAYVLGFLSHWLVTRLSRVSRSEIDELDGMAADLHAAEDARDAAQSALAAAEARLGARLVQAEAELRATMEGLREARAEAEDLRRFISEENMRGR